MPQWLRSVLAILAGFFFIGLLSVGTDGIIRGLYPSAFGADSGTSNTAILVGSTIYVGIYAIIGCWLCAALAGRRPMLHALILGLLGLALNVAGVARMLHLFPTWYAVASVLLTMPYAWIGGKLRERQLERRAVAAPVAA
ncbi:MAG TPA: hypothetical protein VF761_00425 [Gemmatimonadaceae bacterium]